MDFVVIYLFRLIAFIVALSIHEASHAAMAFLLGDNTAKRLGRLSLNPLVHIDPVGLLCLIVFRIGWAKPVMFDHRNFRYPRLYSVLTAYAGPASNFILALLVFLLIKILPMTLMLKKLFFTISQVSVMLGVFNLLPIPPLDGSHILMVTLIDRFPRALAWLYRYSLLILIGLFVLVPDFLHFLWFLIEAVYNFLYGLVF